MILNKWRETEIGKIPEDWNVELLDKLVEKIFCGRDPKGGKLSHSSYTTRYIPDENYIIPHSERGLIRYVLVIFF